MAANMADVSTPFTSKMTEQQMSEYRKRKVALISGASICVQARARP